MRPKVTKQEADLLSHILILRSGLDTIWLESQFIPLTYLSKEREALLKFLSTKLSMYPIITETEVSSQYQKWTPIVLSV